MPKNLTPQDQWETEFQVPLPGEPRNIGPLETLFQRLLNRTERLKERFAEVLGLPWDATPPSTLGQLHNRVSAIEGAVGNRFTLQGSFTHVESINATIEYPVCLIYVDLPSGKRLYLKRLRFNMYDSKLRALALTVGYSYTSATHQGDVALNYPLSYVGPGLIKVELFIKNPSSTAATIYRGDSVWAEFEIR